MGGWAREGRAISSPAHAACATSRHRYSSWLQMTKDSPHHSVLGLSLINSFYVRPGHCVRDSRTTVLVPVSSCEVSRIRMLLLSSIVSSVILVAKVSYSLASPTTRLWVSETVQDARKGCGSCSLCVLEPDPALPPELPFPHVRAGSLFPLCGGNFITAPRGIVAWFRRASFSFGEGGAAYQTSFWDDSSPFQYDGASSASFCSG